MRVSHERKAGVCWGEFANAAQIHCSGLWCCCEAAWREAEQFAKSAWIVSFFLDFFGSFFIKEKRNISPYWGLLSFQENFWIPGHYPVCSEISQGKWVEIQGKVCSKRQAHFCACENILNQCVWVFRENSLVTEFFKCVGKKEKKALCVSLPRSGNLA